MEDIQILIIKIVAFIFVVLGIGTLVNPRPFWKAFHLEYKNLENFEPSAYGLFLQRIVGLIFTIMGLVVIFTQ